MRDVASRAAEGESIARGLSRMLGDTHALYAKSCRFHRDAAGPGSGTLRPTLELQCDELWVGTNLIASRMRALGLRVPLPCGLPPGAAHHGATWTAEEMIGCLAERHELVGRRARGILRLARERQDLATCDLLVQRIQAHESAAWVLAAIGLAELVRSELVALQHG